jgi:hypothetical protein
MIVFDCPVCKSTLQMLDEHAGKLMVCPHCQATATIPGANANAISAEPMPPAPAGGSSGYDDRPHRRDEPADRPAPQKGGISVAWVLLAVVLPPAASSAAC